MVWSMKACQPWQHRNYRQRHCIAVALRDFFLLSDPVKERAPFRAAARNVETARHATELPSL